MKFHHLAAAALIAVSGLAHAVDLDTSLIGEPDGFAIVEDAVLTGATQNFYFDVLGGPLYLQLQADTDGTFSSVNLFSTASSTAITASTTVNLSNKVITLTFANLAVDAYRIAVVGTGTASIYGAVNFPQAPVPEPETYGLALAGLLVAGSALRRRTAQAV